MADITNLRLISRKLGMPGLTTFVRMMRDEAARTPEALSDEEHAVVEAAAEDLGIAPLPSEPA